MGVFLRHPPPFKGPRLILKNKTLAGGTNFFSPKSQNILRKSSKPLVCSLEHIWFWTTMGILKFKNNKIYYISRRYRPGTLFPNTYIIILYNQETKTEIEIVCRPNFMKSGIIFPKQTNLRCWYPILPYICSFDLIFK